MSSMTLYLLCATFFVGGIAAGAFAGWLMGHAEGYDDGVMDAMEKRRGWSL